MELDWLKDFLALAEQKNFSRAADIRNVTQPAFSRRIRALEDWIGTPLLCEVRREPPSRRPALFPAARRRHDSQPASSTPRHEGGGRAREGDAIDRRNACALVHLLSRWIRRHMRFEGLGTLNLISDSMEACEQIMLGGEVHFLLCHYHADARPASSPTVSRASRWATTSWSRSARRTRRAARSGLFQAHRKDRCGYSPTAKPLGLAGSWRHIKSEGTRSPAWRLSLPLISLRRC